MRFPRTKPDYLEITNFMDVMNREKGAVVAILTRMQFEAIVHEYGRSFFHIGKENVNLHVIGMGLPKKSPLLKPFNMAYVCSFICCATGH